MYRAKTISLIRVLLLLTSFSLLSACQPQQKYQQRFLQFGTIIDVTLVFNDDKSSLEVFDEIEQLLIKRHSDWHGWQQGTLKQFNSDLSKKQLNGLDIPPILESLINSSKKYHRISQGLFNPAMGKLIAAWGFHDSSTPDYPLIEQIQKNIPGMHDLVIKNGQAYSQNPYLQLDFGAIAKGLAIHQIAQLLNSKKIQNFIINAGGDIFTQGQNQGKDWQIAIENPFEPGIIASIPFNDANSIFTSGNYQRFYLDENQNRRHHIVHPYTGKPSNTISAATVLHPDPVIADIAATTLMLTKISDLEHMADKLDLVDFMVITDSKDIYISKTLKERLNWSNSDNFSIHIL